MMSCEEHDYIEIACTFQYPVRLILTSGVIIEGRALDTQRNGARDECIKIEVAGVESLVLQNDIARMEALADNPHFQVVLFS
ncbi:MAG: transcriptional regulator [Oceanospirillales bacterium]|uniref:Rof transcriptional antiterminator n=1 Tax=Marinobacterium halophilum TaxID=267374 RepID=A0A2P8F4W3_9GAMM|nr:Rho-binding antiterminator [Marinobacterium halophilum]MBR9829429.1 transcriptional regulator [Oceanospirillales bacterium]PSL16741.1 Rof transcriptional antiterminator [Marinobacterium halophilum]